MNLPDADSDEPIPQDERDKRMPWDRVTLCQPDDWHADVLRVIREVQDDTRRKILRQFRDDRPDDYRFIVDYVSRLGGEVRFRRGILTPISKRGAGFTQQERNRAKAIIDRLRSIEALKTVL
jgi:acetyl-CoA carboxylase alpha subunit